MDRRVSREGRVKRHMAGGSLLGVRLLCICGRKSVFPGELSGSDMTPYGVAWKKKKKRRVNKRDGGGEGVKLAK